jgi:cytoskeletal protein CcmA (bactofilin family)
MTEAAYSNIRRFDRRAARQWRNASIGIASGLLVAMSACASDSYSTINGSVHVAAGRPVAAASTVNGSVTIDEDAAVESVGTVNGGIHVGARATAKSLTTVNGSITVNEAAHTAYIKSVNGNLTVNEGAEVDGGLTTVNGKIGVNAAHIAGRISNVEGDISILGTARVDGGILVERHRGFTSSVHSRDPTIIIGPGAKVLGDLTFERNVHLFVSDRATIGAVTGATAVTFSGDNPPSTR